MRGDQDLISSFRFPFLVPAELHAVRRSIFDVSADPLDKYYDQIAWFDTGSGRKQLNMDYSSTGGF
jgi:hypothetical protein